MNSDGIILSEEEDIIMWIWNIYAGQITAKEAYNSIVEAQVQFQVKWWFRML